MERRAPSSAFESESVGVDDPKVEDTTAVDHPTAEGSPKGGSKKIKEKEQKQQKGSPRMDDKDRTRDLSPSPPTSPAKEKKQKKEKTPKKSKEKKKTPKKQKKGAKTTSNPLDDDVVEMTNPLSDGPVWPTKNGVMVLDKKKGDEMRKAIIQLYDHLRAEARAKGGATEGVKDTFGLFNPAVDSDDEGDEDDSQDKITLDQDFIAMQHALKKNKHAMRIGNADLMSSAEVKQALTKFKKSTKGDIGSLRKRLKAAYEEEALKMRGNSRVVNHFTSDLTSKNLQLMVLKVNQRRAGAVQDKLKGAHGEIKSMEAEIAAQKMMLADLNAKLAVANKNAARIPETVLQQVIAPPTGIPKMALTMAVSTKMSGQMVANWNAWSLTDIADEKARSRKCQVLVLDTSGFKWAKTFGSMKTKDGRQIQCHHSAWHLINVASTSHYGGCAVVDMLVETEDHKVEHARFIPDCVLVRDSPRQVNGEDHTHQLMGIIASRTPCVNESGAVLNCLDRPVVYSELLGIRNKEGQKDGWKFKFPLVEQEYFANEAPASIKPTYPAVTKMSTVHSGFGKLRAEDDTHFNEIASILALSADYFTTETVHEVVSEVYIQWINGNVRTFKRIKSTADGGFRTWSNWGTVQYQEMDENKQYKKWAELVSKIFGGLDIFALNVVVTASGDEFILGMQDCSCPFAPQYASEDAERCAQLVIERIEKTRKERAKYEIYN